VRNKDQKFMNQRTDNKGEEQRMENQVWVNGDSVE
jgi:hypothetical protein